MSAPEHAVIVCYPLTGGGFGEEQERQAIYDLASRLADAVGAADAGDFDGQEFGGGEAVLYAYGPDATRLFAAMEPQLRAFSLRRAFEPSLPVLCVLRRRLGRPAQLMSWCVEVDRGQLVQQRCGQPA
ncbi:hypothetical protein SAMN05443287_101532 [Micromonospora phaseoli]|uniref:Uncharacterized protein n=1 Tax=Micromonospora phaseoli TaxID=1144548 RepID=A0A1H6SEC8_9ACTN|nr:hypothetical protein [Micromonospora phaseoli]PZW03781.1 hypothetical protein CLV64_101532 [Micromonospora phaseoli]GIJ79078.1 hypothetical protein Xph01_35100 [Micromonospora phaseoli]SEI62340.1 hypothetical protein SAMN05443287_101532 [Micromonospora phaseoli]